jgi:chemotaxis protein CheX
VGIATIVERDSKNITVARPIPQAVFFEWRGAQELMLERFVELHKALSFQDIPILLITNQNNIHDARCHTDGQTASVLVIPFSSDAIKFSLKGALTPVGNVKTIDVKLVNPFVEATVSVLKTMAQTGARRRDVLLKKDHKMFGDISGVIGILGKNIEGSVAITFEVNLARELISRMLGTTPDKINDDDLRDGVGELVNMISGNAKTLLSESGYKFDLALPTIVSGHGHEVSHRIDTPCLVIIFETDEGNPFAVQVAIGN